MIEIINQHPTAQIDGVVEALINRAIETTLQMEFFEDDYEVSVVIVDAEQIRIYNRDYRAKDSPTDVLSFVQYEEDGFVANEGEAVFLGDIVLCYDIALEQAEQYGHSTAREIAYLICHSCLHLLGYDHEIDDDKCAMRSREEAIMKQLKLERV